MNQKVNKSNTNKGSQGTHGTHGTVHIICKEPDMQGKMPRSSKTPHLQKYKNRNMKKLEQRELPLPSNVPPPPSPK